MRIEWFATVAACAVMLLAACGEKAGLPVTETTGTTQAVSDTTPQAATTTGASGGTIANMSNADKEFVTKAGMAGLYEVQAANLALQNASSEDVKGFAQQMITDHSRANQELQELATAKGLALPAELAGNHKATVDDLSGLTGAEFDRMYMQHMTSDHQSDVAEFERAAATAEDADLKAWATKTLPTLKQHLQLAQQVAAKR